GDFERWLGQVVGANKLANRLEEISHSNKKLKGEAIRKKIVILTKRRLKQLKKITDSNSKTLKNKRK
ncbi:hypothetical protein KJN74_01105, partial [Candidatus Bathyarchaeota archaeon]|nr:hypothetical protein [Candidatus Bathyarchaeota archaeon]